MKTKILFSALLCLFIGMSSCSINEPGEKDQMVENLVGKWQLEGHTVNGEFIALDGEVMEFKSSGELIGYSEDGEVTGSFYLSGAKLTLNFPGGGDTFFLKSLSKNEMELFLQEEFDDIEGIDDVIYHFLRIQ